MLPVHKRAISTPRMGFLSNRFSRDISFPYAFKLPNYSMAQFRNISRGPDFPGQQPAPEQQDQSEQIIVAVAHDQERMQRAEKQQKEQNEQTQPCARLNASIAAKMLDGKSQRQQQQTQIV